MYYGNSDVFGTGPVGIIQKNKDWNYTSGNDVYTLSLPVGIIQKNKDWNLSTIRTGLISPTSR